MEIGRKFSILGLVCSILSAAMYLWAYATRYATSSIPVIINHLLITLGRPVLSPLTWLGPAALVFSIIGVIKSEKKGLAITALVINALGEFLQIGLTIIAISHPSSIF